ncbi:MAG: amino acid ABC transporter substrate-binding protein [Sphingobacteriaceae bacterium]|nr:MAG: amino acid ABC transporter substrate-binding protein [Sphingobacteriaceae bacterium]
MKRTLLILLAFITLTASLQSCKPSKKADPVPTVLVGGLFSITGNWNTLGKASTAALLIAEADVNTYLDQKNAPFRIAVAYADTKLSADTAVLAFNSAVNGNVKFLIGPQSSAELAAVMPLVGTKALVISQSSTAGTLAIEGDNVFRFCPPDNVEGAAVANSIYNSGITALATVARNDAGNKGLQTATGNTFTQLGGHVTALEPYATSTLNFTSVVASLKSNIETLENTYGEGKVGVYLASFDECVALFNAANNEPVLKNVKWFGGDGVALSAALLANATAADFAIATHFFAPSFGLPAELESRWKPIATRIKTMSGIDADAFALSVYDAVWTLTRAIEANNSNAADIAAIKAKFIEQASTTPGITGNLSLDAAGDRENGVFDYWSLKKDGTTYKWYVVSRSNVPI